LDAAINLLTQSVAIYRDLNDKAGVADGLSLIGNLEFPNGRFADALLVFQQALQLRRELKNRSAEASALIELGSTLQNLARLTEAEHSYQQALEIYREIKIRSGEADALGSMGSVIALRDYRKALDLFQQSLVIARELKDVYREVWALKEIGRVENGLGRFSDALITFQQALAIGREVNVYPSVRAEELWDVAQAEQNLGLYADALVSAQEALDTWRNEGARDQEASSLRNLAVIQLDQGHFADGLVNLQKALSIHRDIKDRISEANDLTYLGQAQFDLGQYDDALRSYQASLGIESQLKNHLYDTYNLEGIARVDLALARYREALAAVQSAGLRSRSVGLKPSLSIAASAEAHLGLRDAALSDYEGSLGRIEDVRAGLAAMQRSSFFGGQFSIYDEYVGYLLDLHLQNPGNGYDRRAFNVLERKEARALLEQIAGSTAQRFQGIPAEVIAQDKSIQGDVDSAQRQIAELSVAANPDAAAIATAQTALNSATAQAATFEKTLMVKYPAYYALLHPKPVALEDLQKSILNTDEAMLVYDVLAEKSVLFVVTRGRIAMIALPGSAALAGAVAQVRAHIDAMLSSGSNISAKASEDLPAFAADSALLYRQLIPPSIVSLITNKRLIIVPSGPLYEVPWEALVTDASGTIPHYLLEDHAISYSPSGSLLAVIRKTDRKRDQREPLLAFANPAYNDSAGDRLAAVPQIQYNTIRDAVGGKFVDLPGTALEAARVRDALHASADSIISGEDATKARLFSLNETRQLSQYRYLLFATHAVLPHEVQGIDQPALVLAHPSQDGFVTMADVFNLSLDADFVALSACSTGEGARDPGDGISGMTRAFMYAGTPAISVTLWQVDDAAAPQISAPFFAAMSVDVPPSEALREAKLKMLRSGDPRFRHPYAWAPTVIFGDGDAARE
jgi:CHAT domain-containing protein